LIVEQSLESKEVEIIIKCGLIDEHLEKLIDQIRRYSFSINGKKDGINYKIPLESIFYFEASEDKTFIYGEKAVYECDLKLYELEQQLAGTNFVRISKSCILNIMHLNSVRPLFHGKFEAQLKNQEKVIINRHYVPKFKEKFGL